MQIASVYIFRSRYALVGCSAIVWNFPETDWSIREVCLVINELWAIICH